MRTFAVAFAVLVSSTGLARAEGDKPLLLQKPTISKSQVAFVFAGDLWIVGREGGEARRLTSGVGLETDPVFSPDGSQIAFTGEYEGNFDVYVVPAGGGQPRRLTYHPGGDFVVGWTPDGKNILFRSARASYARFEQLFTVPAEGGFPQQVPLPMGVEGSFSPDGLRIAYVPFWNRRSTPNAYIAWKRYRGGLASPIWIATLADGAVERVPRTDSNDFSPMWVGDRVFFLSDRSGPTTLYAYDTSSKRVEQVLPNDGMDVSSASAGPDAVVYEQFGSLHVYDLNARQSRPLSVHIAADLPALRPHLVNAAKQIQSATISPTGKRAVFSARGDILTVPAEKGPVRNLTETPGVAERDPAWSPDGKSIAYLSDESGEYQLHVRDQQGGGTVRKYALGDPPTFYYQPVWSPDSKKIAYTDKRLNLWVIDLASGKNTKVATDTYDTPFPEFDPAWSPDSRWIAYDKQLKNHLHAVFVFDVESGKTHQVTDGLSDARYPQFDREGKYLYFTASTDSAPTSGWLDMSSMQRPVSSSVYIVVLDKGEKSPLAPESDDEPTATPKVLADGVQAPPVSQAKGSPLTPATQKGKKAPTAVRIDFENIDQRTLPLPIPPHNYVGLAAGKSGTLFLLEAAPVRQMGPPVVSLHRFDLAKRKTDKVLDGISEFDLSADGEKFLYKRGEGWFINAAAGPPPAPGQGALKLDGLEVRVDPKADWRQMYREVWRIERDFLYDPGLHGLDLKATEKKYEPYLDGLGSRADLNYLFAEMLGELTLGHTYVAGGDAPEVKEVKGGLLGADYAIENGRYRFAKIYRGENWNPQTRAPLTQPGVDVAEGEYLLAVNGRDLKSSDNVYQAFEATAGKSVVIKVGPNADGKGAREVTVVPLDSERALRNLNWIDENRRKVDRLSGGRVAYIYLPDTSFPGYTNFNRYYFAQVDKPAAVVDERFNGGGTAADYIIDAMRRPLLNYWTTREGEDFTTPVGSIYGPKAMIVNEFAGSGGDAMPWYFRRAKVGPLVGKRTWGGLVGIYKYPQLIDGGIVTAPRVAFWNPEGQWDVENHGVAPDVEVEFDPQAVRAGHDPQLEKAVAIVLEELERHPLPHPKKPPYPNYHPTTTTQRKDGGAPPGGR